MSALAALHVRVDERGTATVAIRALAQSARVQGAPAAPPAKTPALAAAEEATRSWAAHVAEGWAQAAKIAEGWERVSSFSCGYVPIEVWRAANGVRVVNVQVEGPLVHSYIVIATECLSDNGLPHTLEHLVFLGSEDFPYKGVLDKVAFRNLATGTNAYTDVHHTAYTLSTAGTEGTLALLPVFLDHVLYPTITDAGFVTEVYHVDGEGAEAGVVFSEMQAIENESGSLAYLALRKCLYPGECGYAMETGGIMSGIRSLTVDQIREYHRTYYRPDNCFIIVAGKVGTGELLSAGKKFPQKSVP